jgi:hypothetical protein
MPTLSVDDFKAKLIGGGARANLFKVIVNNPPIGAGLSTELLSFTCKGAQLPGSVVAQIDVHFRGRQLKVAGDRTFENWTITVYNEDAQDVRNSFERWMNSINQHVGNAGEKNPLRYQADLIVQQIDRQGKVTKEYDIRGAFPVNISAIDLSYDANDAIEEFTVEFAYQYWESNTTS